MSNRTFCVLLASVLMIAGAVTALFFKKPADDRGSIQEAMQAYQAEKESIERMTLPDDAEVIEAYGASYSEEYGQWSMCERMKLTVKTGNVLYAPLSGVVEQIERMEGEELFGAGSRISIGYEGISVWIYPVYGVRVFEGSRVTQESILGSMGDQLMIYAERHGLPVDPMAVTSCVQ